jgi:serine/threonine protein kinase
VTSPGYPRFDDRSCGRQLPLRAGEVLAGKYRIEQVIGSGAMGLVARAWHIELEQPVAIKFLHQEHADDAVGAERFRREARAAARIRSPHVARVLDVGALEESGIPFIVMEYLDGRDLARELAACGPLEVHRAVGYVLEACDAVAEAHSHGVVHRDLKPANLFLAQRTSGTPMVKVLDFGVSKLGGASTEQLSITDTAMLMGSPAYMSPEQLESSRNVDARSDIWSLGVILHELCAGALPFTGESVPQLVRAIVTGARRPLGELGASAELEPVIVRCLQQDPARRYQTVAELCAALQPIARSNTAAPGPGRTLIGHPGPMAEPVGAEPDGARAGSSPPEGAWGRTFGSRRKTWQRHRVPLGAVFGLLAALGAWAARGKSGPARAERSEVALAPLRAEQAPVAEVPSIEAKILAPAPHAAPDGVATDPPPPLTPTPLAPAPPVVTPVVPAPAAPAPLAIEHAGSLQGSTPTTVPIWRATPSPPPRIEVARAPADVAQASATDAGVARDDAPESALREPGPSLAPLDVPPAPPLRGRIEIPEFGGRE